MSYIDALDECAEDEVRELLTYFEDLAEETMIFSEGPRVCFSSRPYPCEMLSFEYAAMKQW